MNATMDTVKTVSVRIRRVRIPAVVTRVLFDQTIPALILTNVLRKFIHVEPILYVRIPMGILHVPVCLVFGIMMKTRIFIIVWTLMSVKLKHAKMPIVKIRWAVFIVNVTMDLK